MNSTLSRTIRIGTVLGVMMVLLLGGLWLSRQTESPASAQMATMQPVRRTLELKAVSTGTIAPRKEVKIKSQVNGVLEEIVVQPGERVRQGDVVARIRLLADPVDVNATQSQVSRAKREFDRAQIEWARRTQLHEQHMISDSEMQTEQLHYDLSKEQYEAAGRALELKLKGTSRHMAVASTRVIATADGMVLEKPVEVGDFIVPSNPFSEGTTIISIADMDRLIFKGEVEEADAGRLKEGMPLTITVGALPQHRFEATLEYIAPKVKKSDQGRLTFEIRAALALNPDVFVRAGYSAMAEIILARHDHVLTVPERALLFHDDGVYLRLLSEAGTIEERQVKTGFSDGLHIEIVQGLEENVPVVVPDF